MTKLNEPTVQKPQQKTVQCKAWIGHVSYINHKNPTVSSIIFDTAAEAKRAGWKNPSRVMVTLVRKKP